MEVRQLQTFCVLAEELNFTRTAERVYTVQSNVTSQIKSLEAELGSPLFDRLAKRVVLTEAGHRFRPYAEKALAAMDEGCRAVKFGSEPAGPLHIGAPESVLTYRLPEVLKLFRKRYPRVELIFRPDSDNKLADELESGKLDLAISMSDLVAGDQLSSIKMRSEDIYLFATPDHPLANAKKVYPKDLSDQTLLLTEAGCGYRKKLDMQLASAQVRPQHVTEFSSVEAIKQCVLAGMGIGLLPEIVIACELKKKQFTLMNWHGAKMSIATHMVWHKDKWISPGMQAFQDILRAKLQETSSPTLVQHLAM
ncbi:MAG TPA: LysR family transcriptional regulator [Acidobacteriaceae bacterium]|nr:LysR family transcriptional regulator [Acidobacteriaceae bacterium]